MGLWTWFRRRSPREDSRLGEWRRQWAAAAATLDTAAADRLRRLLEGFNLPEDDVEIEREMLDGLDEATTLAAVIGQAGLPVVATGHRVVAHDRCHFMAAASMPDEPGQPTGRLLLTNARAIFVGGPSAVSSAWHMIGEARYADRSLVLVRTARDRIYRFQCNSFGDALRAALIARELIRRKPSRGGVRL
jgi:hypothetical protein